MQVIPPIEINDDRLTSTDIPEVVASTYSSGTTYVEGDLRGLAPVYGSPQVVWKSKQGGNLNKTLEEGDWWTNRGEVYSEHDTGSSCGIGGIVNDIATHSLYESLVVSNNFPLDDVADEITKWKYIGKTNRWRPLDYTRSQRSVTPLSVTYVITPGKRINSLALENIKANSFSISISSPSNGGEVWARSGSLNTRITTSFSDYFFGVFGTKPSLVYFDIPLYSDLVITITLEATSGNVEVGAIMAGTFVYLGETEQSTSSDTLNFSTIDRDLDGNAILVRRRNIPKSRQTVFCRKSNVDKVVQLRDELNATPALWYGLKDSSDGYFGVTSSFGIYKGFQIDTSFPNHAVISLELEDV